MLPVLAALGTLAASSWLALEKAEASSSYIAGHYAYFNTSFSDDPELVDRGIVELKVAVAGDPDVVPLAESHCALAALLVEQGANPLPHLKQAVADLPTDGRLALALYLCAGGNMPQPPAAADLLQRNPAVFFATHATLYHRRGKQRMTAGDYGATIEALRQSLVYAEKARAYGIYDSKTHFHALFHLATAHSLQGQHQEALARYTEALHLRPDHAAARYNLGLAHRELGDIAAARQQVELLAPSDPELARMLTDLLER